MFESRRHVDVEIGHFTGSEAIRIGLVGHELEGRMALEAWYLDANEDDQRKPHRHNPNRPVSLEQLKTLGVFYWKVTVGF